MVAEVTRNYVLSETALDGEVWGTPYLSFLSWDLDFVPISRISPQGDNGSFTVVADLLQTFLDVCSSPPHSAPSYPCSLLLPTKLFPEHLHLQEPNITQVIKTEEVLRQELKGSGNF